MEHDLLLPPFVSDTAIEYTTSEVSGAYENYWNSIFGTTALLDVMRSNIRIFTQAEFENGIDYIATLIKSMQRNNPIVLIHQGEGRSGGFVRDYLVRAGVMPDFEDFTGKHYDCTEIVYPEDVRAIAVDDVFYRLTELRGNLWWFRHATHTPSSNIYVSVIGGTNTGVNDKAEQYGIVKENIFRRYQVPVMKEILSREQITEVIEGFNDWNLSKEYIEGAVLSMLYYKIPDVFFDPLRRCAQGYRGSNIYLVDDDEDGSFRAPYRNESNV